MRIACIGYRDWAFGIYEELMQDRRHVFLLIRGKEAYDESSLIDFKPDLVLFYGWSWIVGTELLSRFVCLMLHPAPLPLYRGGSPIQNQIIEGKSQSAVTLFVMTAEMDAGDIVGQTPLSLEGSLEEIFRRITSAGVALTRRILAEGLVRIPQEHSKATYCKRRKPADSEITPEELRTATAEYLYNKVRMLAEPYPPAYIRTHDGKRLLVRDVEIATD